MNKLVVIDDFISAGGGATQLALQSAKQGRINRFRVTYISGDSGSNADLEALGVEIVTVGGAPLLDRPAAQAALNGLFDNNARSVLQNWIRNNDDSDTVYHLHGWAQTLSPSVFSALNPVASRVILHAHDYFLVCPNGAYYNYRDSTVCDRAPLSMSCLSTNCDKRSHAQKLWRCGRQIVQRSLFNLSQMGSKIILIHERMLPIFEKAGLSEARCCSIRNPVTPFCEKRVEAEQNSNIFYVGRVQEEKGIEDVISATALAGLRLVVIGDGPLRKSLAQKHPDVAFLGWMTREEIALQIRTARLLVMPSRYPEPFGMVCLEASASGIPVVVPPSALLASDIANSEIGYVCDTRDHARLADTLSTAAGDDALIREMSLKAYSLSGVLAPSPAEWGKRLAEIYDSALHAK